VNGPLSGESRDPYRRRSCCREVDPGLPPGKRECRPSSRTALFLSSEARARVQISRRAILMLRGMEAPRKAANRTIRLAPHYPNTYRWLAAALGQLGRTDEARDALQKAMAVAPAVFEMYVRQRPPWFRPEDYAHMLEGLSKAGMPEQ
jgi:tetratricopeptide (TPR) repeat protein